MDAHQILYAARQIQRMMDDARHDEAWAASFELLHQASLSSGLDKLLAEGYGGMFMAALELKQPMEEEMNIPAAWENCLKAMESINSLTDTDIRDAAQERCMAVTRNVVTRMVDETEEGNRVQMEDDMMSALQGMSLTTGGGAGQQGGSRGGGEASDEAGGGGGVEPKDEQMQ